MSDSAKYRRAILVSVHEEDGGFRISLDDVVSSAASARTWTQKEHVTSKPAAQDAFQKMEFDEKELADFGHYILSRLSAFVTRKEN